MKKQYSIMAFVFALIMFISSTAFASADESFIGNMIAYEREKQIEELLNKRAELLTEDNVDIAALNDIDRKLVKLGVEFLSSEEVARQFPQEKAIKDLVMYTKREVSSQTEVSPQVDTPTSNVNTWTSYRVRYYYNGKYYNVQKLIAQPKSPSSPLQDVGSRVVYFSSNWQAGVQNVFETAAWSALGLIPKASIAITFYDAIRSFWDGIKTTMEVRAPHIVYSWSSVTTVVFSYVRLDDQTDDYQWLSHISTKTNTVVGYQIPTVEYKNSSGTWTKVPVPDVIQGKRTIEIVPDGYNDTLSAIIAYNSGRTVHAAVERIKISGPESKTVQYIYPCYPQFPIHCE